jgi:bacteriorhodopsin
MLFNRARADFLRVFVYCFLDVFFFLFFVCFLFVEYFNTKKRIDNACNKDTATVMHDDDFLFGERQRSDWHHRNNEMNERF